MDKMLTGTSKKKVPNKERIGNLPRPNSDLDLNEVEEDQYHLDNLGDEEVCFYLNYIENEKGERGRHGEKRRERMMKRIEMRKEVKGKREKEN